MNEVYYDCSRVAGWLNVATRTIWKWYDDGKLRGHRDHITNDRMVSRSSVVSLCRDNGFDLPLSVIEGADAYDRSRNGAPPSEAGADLLDA